MVNSESTAYDKANFILKWLGKPISSQSFSKVNACQTKPFCSFNNQPLVKHLQI